jgi:uncharacterized protein YecT (DUF1311 family)
MPVLVRGIVLVVMIFCAGPLALGVEPTTGPASQPAAVQIAVPFEVHDGYFVSNKFEADTPTSYVVLYTQDDFDRVFGVAQVMHDTSHRMAKDGMDTHVVVAMIKRDKVTWSYKVTSVTQTDGTEEFTIHYTATANANIGRSAEFASPLIIALPDDIYGQVQFVENGKVVKTLEQGYVDLSDKVGVLAQKADVVLNKVYKQVMELLGDTDKKKLVKAQRAWLAFRDAECDFETHVTSGEASIRLVNGPMNFTSLTKERVKNLQSMIQAIKEAP